MFWRGGFPTATPGSDERMSSPFFSPITLGAFELPNRIVLAPMTRSRSDDAGRVPGYAADYYAQRADAALVISEATNISPQAVGYALTPGIWSDDQVEAWKPVVDAVHDRGGRFLLQLWHTGRISHPDLHDGELPVAPSAIRPEGQAFTKEGMKDHVQPRALQTAEIPSIVEDYRHAAMNAKLAGFDGVEIHSANNYLLEQFIRDTTNHRDDEYGGNIENRCASRWRWSARSLTYGVPHAWESVSPRQPPSPAARTSTRR